MRLRKKAVGILTSLGLGLVGVGFANPNGVNLPAFTIQPVEEYSAPKIGEKFPTMRVHTTLGTITLPDYYTRQGKWFILFSHPADFTPVCTTEFVSFQKHYEDFKKLNTELIGLSEDQVWAHIKWIEWIKKTFGVEIQFPIIADVGGKVAKRLNMLPENGVDTVRAVFIVDNRGIIRAILYYPLENGRNIVEILRLLKAIQTTTKYGVATPANWKANEMPWTGPEVFNGKNNVIIPPAQTIQEKNKRLMEEKEGAIKCFDWWFCYTSLED
jgi:peroxiredoxin (alkyl hydroperoxide reductase subunit C)